MRSVFGWDLPPGVTQRHIDGGDEFDKWFNVAYRNVERHIADAMDEMDPDDNDYAEIYLENIRTLAIDALADKNCPEELRHNIIEAIIKEFV